MADLIARLPETVDSPAGKLRSVSTRIRLVNESAASVYQWGQYEPPPSAKPFCEVPLSEPLASWRLQCFVPENQLKSGTSGSVYVSLLAGLFGVAIALAVIAFFFMREYARDMRQAAQQVSFVNQVSHELKTPLTNIRMYAEMLECDLDKLDESADPELVGGMSGYLLPSEIVSLHLLVVLLGAAYLARAKRRVKQLPGNE